MILTDEQKAPFTKWGSESAKKRFEGMTPEEIKNYMKQVRAKKKNPSNIAS